MRDSEKSGYIYNGDTKHVSPMGDNLKPVYEMEIANLTDEKEIEMLQQYLEEIKEDPDVNAISKLKNRQLSPAQKMEMFKKDPGGMFIIKDGKRVSISQYMKNKKSMNNRMNYDYKKPTDEKFGGESAKGIPNGDFNAMAFNQKKVI